MAAGKPVIASNIEGYANLISPGMEGLLVKPKSEKSLAKALSYLLENKPLREKMGVMGRHKAEDYRWEYIASEIVDYYQNLLESSHKGK
jgi:phosphatidylinositol alpha-mannosyltransferase